MTCESARDAISAIADGEAPGLEPGRVEVHLRTCAGCRQFRLAIERTRLITPVGVAPDMPDLGRRVSKLAAVADRAASWGFARAVLAVVAVQILILAVPSLVAPDESGLVAHDSRHLGTFVIAYAVALVVVVVRPARARSVLPVASVLACALVITAVVDLVNGNVPLLGEALHVPELLSVLMVWVLASPGRRLRPIGSRAPAVELTVVDDARRVGPPEAQLQSPRQAPE